MAIEESTSRKLVNNIVQGANTDSDNKSSNIVENLDNSDNKSVVAVVKGEGD